MGVKTLAEKVGAQPDLLRMYHLAAAHVISTANLDGSGRIMRELTALCVVDQTGKDEYGANTNTKFYAEPEWEEAMSALCVPLLVLNGSHNGAADDALD